jgi:hypothetical protein
MNKTLLLFFILSALAKASIAQDFPYGKVSQQEMEMMKYPKDTSANAVILQEYGKSRITTGGEDELLLIFEYHVKIKIFNAKGFENATAAIVLRNDEKDNKREEVTDISGVTSYKDDDGLTRQAELDPSKLYTTRDYKYQRTSKFTMPGLRNGCVIDYKYTVTSPVGFFLDEFHPWEFQTSIPKVYSEYEVFIPGHFNYNAILRGKLKLTKNTSRIESGCFSASGGKSDCSNIVYAMSDIPAFIEEDDMTAPKNFISAINFDLVDFTNPYDGTKVKVTKEWRDIDYQLKTELNFGVQLKKKDLFKDRLAPVLTGKTNELDKAKAIYAYVQKWFKWNDYIGIYSENGIKKALEAHSGGIADINLALITALNSAGINTDAVLLSTRDHGNVNDLYPALNDFNYVIAKANIGDKSYLLDATDPLLAFGMLPLHCLNDKGRVFSLDKPSYWMDMAAPQRENDTYTYDLTLQDDGKLKGTIIHYSTGYSGYLKRKEIRKFNSVDEYIENFGEKQPKMKILKSAIANLDSLDQTLSETYDVELNIYNNLNHDRLGLNPFIQHWITTNPYKLASRDYPVDLGMPSDERYILTVHLPVQYAVENPPKNNAFTMPNNGGKFLTSFDNNNNTFTFSYVIEINKPIYDTNEYPYLKELYNQIIQSEKADLVFKKNK